MGGSQAVPDERWTGVARFAIAGWRLVGTWWCLPGVVLILIAALALPDQIDLQDRSLVLRLGGPVATGSADSVDVLVEAQESVRLPTRYEIASVRLGYRISDGRRLVQTVGGNQLRDRGTSGPAGWRSATGSALAAPQAVVYSVQDPSQVMLAQAYQDALDTQGSVTVLWLIFGAGAAWLVGVAFARRKRLRQRTG